MPVNLGAPLPSALFSGGKEEMRRRRYMRPQEGITGTLISPPLLTADRQFHKLWPYQAAIGKL